MTRLIFASAKDSDMHYAVKTPITSSFFYLENRGKKYAFLDRIDLGIIPKKEKVRSVLVNPLSEEAKKLRFKTTDRNKLAYYILKKYGLMGKEVKVPIHFPLDMADFLRGYGAKLTPTFPFFSQRAVKSKEEIRHVQESLAHTKMAFRIIENILRKSRIEKNRIYYRNKILTSKFLKQEAEKALIEKGMFDFLGMIISSGEQTAIPHHSGSGPIRPHQPIVCDIFPRHRQSGYFADMTRTFVKGKPSPEIEKMYAVVLKTQMAAMKKIRAGASAKKIYESAAEVILKNGYHVGEKGFTHGLGHGVGLDVHEKPSIKPHSNDVLRAGNIITVEPGLYYPSTGLTRQSKAKAVGIRIEDVVLITKTGYINLTNYPKKLVIS
jgi:Xaa-Pro aminopeptidase